MCTRVYSHHAARHTRHALHAHIPAFVSQSVKSFVRKRAYKQRALTTLGLFFSDDFQIDVSLYALLLPAPGPRKVTTHAASGRLVRPVTATVNAATGAHRVSCCYISFAAACNIEKPLSPYSSLLLLLLPSWSSAWSSLSSSKVVYQSITHMPTPAACCRR